MVPSEHHEVDVTGITPTKIERVAIKPVMTERRTRSKDYE
ncbi:uncharacterized protein METZ01_LOCUS324401 [marine metagenome]|uniref:Uncharacterized protein n=1 Tax=marine metagenome TaxID=408172 RepID=A0A382PFA9_9ZZZZ